MELLQKQGVRATQEVKSCKSSNSTIWMAITCTKWPNISRSIQRTCYVGCAANKTFNTVAKRMKMSGLKMNSNVPRYGGYTVLWMSWAVFALKIRPSNFWQAIIPWFINILTSWTHNSGRVSPVGLAAILISFMWLIFVRYRKWSNNLSSFCSTLRIRSQRSATLIIFVLVDTKSYHHEHLWCFLCLQRKWYTPLVHTYSFRLSSMILGALIGFSSTQEGQKRHIGHYKKLEF
jgi:hypothetical protein